MKSATRIAFLLPLALCAAVVQADDNATDSLLGMVTDGNAALDFRYRYENVDQDNLDRTASANTLRSRLTLSSASWHGVSLLGEVDNVTDFGSDDYNSLDGDNADRPVIADPTGTDLNQLWIRWAGESADATGGRQRINMANQRFVGGVGWRQNEQTYDGVRGQWQPLEGLSLDGSYVANVRRIFGPDDGANPSELEGDNFFFRADYAISDQHKVGAYGYWLDFDDDEPFVAGKTVNLSSDTYGIDYAGKIAFVDLAAAWATQSEAGDSELEYDADYYFVELGTTFDIFSLKAGYEVLAGDDGVGFATPLATGHKFQGWADQFLATPGDGVEDLYGSVATTLGAWKLQAIYHEFQAEDSSEDFGTELDLSVSRAIGEHFNLQAKYASFDADSERYSDTDKFWLVVQFRY